MWPCPCRVWSGAGGVSATLWPDLDAEETEKLRSSAEILKSFVDELGI
jgi:hypothetical protein